MAKRLTKDQKGLLTIISRNNLIHMVTNNFPSEEFNYDNLVSLWKEKDPNAMNPAVIKSSKKHGDYGVWEDVNLYSDYMELKKSGAVIKKGKNIQVDLMPQIHSLAIKWEVELGNDFIGMDYYLDSLKLTNTPAPKQASSSEPAPTPAPKVETPPPSPEPAPKVETPSPSPEPEPKEETPPPPPPFDIVDAEEEEASEDHGIDFNQLNFEKVDMEFTTKKGIKVKGSYRVHRNLKEQKLIIGSVVDDTDFILLDFNRNDVDHPDERLSAFYSKMKHNFLNASNDKLGTGLVIKSLLLCIDLCEHTDQFGGLVENCMNEDCPVHHLWYGKAIRLQG